MVFAVPNTLYISCFSHHRSQNRQLVEGAWNPGPLHILLAALLIRKKTLISQIWDQDAGPVVHPHTRMHF